MGAKQQDKENALISLRLQEMLDTPLTKSGAASTPATSLAQLHERFKTGPREPAAPWARDYNMPKTETSVLKQALSNAIVCGNLSWRRIFCSAARSKYRPCTDGALSDATRNAQIVVVQHYRRGVWQEGRSVWAEGWQVSGDARGPAQSDGPGAPSSAGGYALHQGHPA